MLTPGQVKNYQFSISGRGMYRATEVDDFLEEVSASYDQMFKENGELVKKIGLLADRLEEYHNDEDNIRAALLTAQRMADKILKEAKANAEKDVAQAEKTSKEMLDSAKVESTTLLENAQTKSDELLAQANSHADTLKKQAEEKALVRIKELDMAIEQESRTLEQIKDKAETFRTQLLALYEEQVKLIDEMPEYVAAQLQRSEIAQELLTNQEVPAVQEEVTEKEVEVPEVEEEKEEEVYEDVNDIIAAFNLDLKDSDKEEETTSSAFKLELDKIDLASEHEDIAFSDFKAEEKIAPEAEEAVEETKTVIESSDGDVIADYPEKDFYNEDDDDTDLSFKSLFRKR